MTMHKHQSRELAALLEKWCEETLTASEMARLEELVLSDRAAMRRYLAYVQLHGTLHWDAAVAADQPGQAEAKRPRIDRRVSRPGERVSPPRPRALWRSMTVVACAGLLVLTAAWFWMVHPSNGPNQPIASHVAEPATETPSANPAAADEQPAPQRPIVRLDPRVEKGTSLAIAGAPPVGPSPAASSSSETPTTDAAPAEPVVAAGPSTTEDIVAFINEELEAEWEANGVTPSPAADDAEWLRRVYLDLTGQIPPLSVLDRFEQSRDPHKRADLVERLLGGEEFAQHFTTVWANQLVGRSPRTAHERHGLQEFLLDQFRENRPWNETVAELIAAEGSVRENGAAGFLMAHLNNQAVPATAITARLFLGQQVQCTQCHKHPWNEWTQDQFWSLNAFFQQTKIRYHELTDSAGGRKQRERVLVNEFVGGPTYFEDRRGVMQVTFPIFEGQPIDPGPQTNRRRELASLLGAGHDGQLARAFVNRMWERLFGYGFTIPVDDMGPHNPPSYPQLLERLSREFVAAGYDVQQLIRWITSCRAYHLSSRFGEGNAVDDPASGDPPLFSRMPLRTFTPGQVFDSLEVATSGRTRGEFDFAARRDARETWVQQFIDAQENEENSEVSTFGDTLTQALAMMNGPLVSAALSGEPETVLGQILAARVDDEERIRRLCRTALARDPSPEELTRFRRLVGQAKAAHPQDPRRAVNEVLRDIYWAYLNSREFVTIR